MGDAQGRPAKRPRLSFTPGSPSPDEVPVDFDLSTARAQNDQRLKSIFEGIFDKYGKDFTEVGDEIDLETGKIVINNGHLVGMRAEDDPGDQAQEWLFHDAISGFEYTGDDDPEARSLEEGENERDLETETGDAPSHFAQEAADSDDDRESADSLWDSALAYKDTTAPDSPIISQDFRPKDPLWQVPDIDAKFSTPTTTKRVHFAPVLNTPRSASPPGAGSLWSLPKRGRPRTDGRPKTTPSKRKPRAKRNRDWSFAQTPDADSSESDDPLQENQASPTPSKLINIRGGEMLKAGRAQTSGQAFDLDKPTAASEDEKPDTHNIVTLEAPTVHDNTPIRQQAETVPAQPLATTPSTPKRGVTPDAARQTVRMRHIHGRKWKQISDSLPGFTWTQLYVWNQRYWTERRANPPLLSAPWSQTEQETLAWLKDQRGLSWAEIHTEFPKRSLPEIQFELLRLWVGDAVWNDEGMENSAVDEQEQDQPKPRKPASETLKPSTDQVPSFSQRLRNVPDAQMRKPLKPVGAREHPPNRDRKMQDEFAKLVEDDEDDIVVISSQASSPSKLSAIHLDSPARSRIASKSPGRPSPAKRMKMTL
ncbi:hypothetical protein N7474_003790 [Penicillium riverlandense]|uniref:uncharacterized protein n=1 Tax=Penicillium riverlandense TaxID=1903569 RepID=UPI00254865CB|nr:uncharacterized protein N7474_003790 [Penicillium riverlandense]KAJ5818199.1 hypothetical protein N7474_003790 [Penicillium riverlandense]